MSSVLDLFWNLYHWLLRLVDPGHPISLALRAEQALERQQWGHAFDLSNSALKKRADLAPAYFARSMARLNLDDYRGALHDLNRFLALTDDPPPLVYYWRGWIYTHRAEWAMALADFDRVVAVLPDEPQVHYWRTFIFWQREEWPRMAESLAALEASSPDSALAWEMRGHLLLHEERYQEAEDAYSRAMELGWESPELRYNRALARRHLGHTDEARQDINAIFRLDPHNSWAHLELSNFAFEEGEYADALRHARAALLVDDGFFEARLSEAATLMALERYDEARTCLEALQEEFPAQPLVEQLLGDLHATEGQPEAAIERYRRSLELEPGNQSVRLKLAGELLTLQRAEEAEAIIAEVLEAEPDNLDAYATRADLYRYTNRPDEMRADLDHLLSIDPANAWALAFRAAHRHWLGDTRGALADYDAALEADSNQAWIWAFRGQLLLRHGRLASAREDFQQAITLDPRDPWVRRQWANLLSHSGHEERAMEVLSCLLDDYPDDGYARLACVELHLLAGQWEGAVEQLTLLLAGEHELTWLAHAILAVFTSGEERARHLARAEAERPAPSYWGMTPSTILAQQALVAWQHGESDAAVESMREAMRLLESGEQPWRGLAPLFRYLDAQPLLAVLAATPVAQRDGGAPGTWERLS